MLYVFDLDGTLADCTHRLHHITGVPSSKRNYDAFYDACDRDKPIWQNIRLLIGLQESGADVAIWTARRATVREKTLLWLADYDCLPSTYSYPNARARHTGFMLKMRDKDDKRGDVDVKRAWLHEATVKPDIVFEDRQRCVDMWRSEGIMCHQVAPGGF